MLLWKRVSAFLLILTVTVSCVLFYSTAETVQNLDIANKLKALNLFIGSDKGFELDKNFTREESVVMVLRLQGLEKTARDQNLTSTFVDVPASHWAKSYVAYATNIGLTKGIGFSKFGLGSNVTTEQYVTYVLRALGYNDSNGDFNWQQSIDKAFQVGLLSSTEVKYFKTKASVAMLRDDVVAISYNALKTRLKGTDKTLLRKLIDAGAVTINQVNSANDPSLSDAVKATPTRTPTNTPVRTSTPTPTATSSARNAYSQIEAEHFNSKSGVEIGTCTEGGQAVEWIENGDYIVFKNIDFGSSASAFEARVASGSNGGNIEIRIDGINGRKVGDCSVARTGGWQSWVTRTCSISGATGKHDVYLRFTGSTGYLFALNWFKFITTAPTPVVVLYSDNFDDGNANGWLPYGGTWAIENRKYGVNPGTEAKSIVYNTNYTNFIYTADVTIGTSGSAGVIFDVTSPSTGTYAFNGYYVGIDANNDRIDFMRMSTNTFTLITSAWVTIEPYTSYRLRIVRSGGYVKIYLNDMNVPKIDSYDATYSSGSIGVRALDTHALFDNISVNTITATPTPTPSPTPVLRSPVNAGYLVNGLDYRYYEGDWDNLPNFNSRTPNETGVVANFNLSPKNRDDRFGFVYTGYINISVGGNYNFYTSSDDGSRLYIGNQLVVDNDGKHSASEVGGTIGLAPGVHPITVHYFNSTGDSTLEVRYSGPNLSKRMIPESVLLRSAPTPVPTSTSTRTPTPTHIPTHTPVSTATPTLAPTPTPSY